MVSSRHTRIPHALRRTKLLAHQFGRTTEAHGSEGSTREKFSEQWVHRSNAALGVLPDIGGALGGLDSSSVISARSRRGFRQRRSHGSRNILARVKRAARGAGANGPNSPGLIPT